MFKSFLQLRRIDLGTRSNLILTSDIVPPLAGIRGSMASRDSSTRCRRGSGANPGFQPAGRILPCAFPAGVFGWRLGDPEVRLLCGTVPVSADFFGDLSIPSRLGRRASGIATGRRAWRRDHEPGFCAVSCQVNVLGLSGPWQEGETAEHRWRCE